MKRRMLSIILATGLIAGLFAGTFSAAAADDLPRFTDIDFYETIFFPFVPHGEMVDELGPWYGGITVQNLQDRGVRIFTANSEHLKELERGDTTIGELPSFVLPPHASQTLTHRHLELDEPGSAVVVYAVFRELWEARDQDTEHLHDLVFDICGAWYEGVEDEGWWETCKPSIAGVAKQTTPEPMGGELNLRTGSMHEGVNGYNAIPGQDIAWGAQSTFCAWIFFGEYDYCNGSGYYENFSQFPDYVFDGHSYLPIVQTNTGWNTVVHISNIDTSEMWGSVDVTFITTDQQGFGSSGAEKYSFSELVRVGDTWTIDLLEYGLPEEWVGSVHITSNVGVASTATRVKAETNMAMTNVAAPSIWAATSLGTEWQSENDEASADATFQFLTPDRVELYAPLVFKEYNGWNTGISIANIEESPISVTVTYFGPTGNVLGSDQRTVSPQGQEFIYVPSDQDLGLDLGFVGSALLSGTGRFHAAVDQVKYSTGEAMSYSATATGVWADDVYEAPWITGDYLALPLVQKGQQNGLGDTTGFQLFNASAHGEVNVEVQFYNQSGAVIDPTRATPYGFTIPATGNFTVYTMTLSEMNQNALGSAIVRVAGGTGQLVGVSNTVNYAVAGDGALAVNLVNPYGRYRLLN